MKQLFEITANIVGLLGVLICLVAGLARFAGGFHLAGFEAMTLFTGGLGLMVFSGLVKLELILAALRRPHP